MKEKETEGASCKKDKLDLPVYVPYQPPWQLLDQHVHAHPTGTNVNKDAKITAAVASNIWSAYEKGGRMAFNNEDMQFMFMECEEGKVRGNIILS